MLLDRDDALPDDIDPSSSRRISDDAPRVAVVYRTRGVPWLWIPPLLILVAIASVLVARRFENAQPLPVYLSCDVPPPPPPYELVGPSASLRPEPLRFEPVPIPLPIPDVPLPAELAREHEPARVVDSVAKVAPEPPAETPTPVRDPVGFDPDALKTAVIADPPSKPVEETPPIAAPAEPTEEEPDRPFDLDDARRDARRIADQRRRIAATRRPTSIPASAVERKLKEEHVVLARREAESRRKPFLDDLRKLLREGGPDLARNIDALADEYGRVTAPELIDAAFLELRGPAARFTNKGKVTRLRLWGLPEPIILDHLIDAESGDVGGRHGPKVAGDAVIRAARQLVSIPLPAR